MSYATRDAALLVLGFRNYAAYTRCRTAGIMKDKQFNDRRLCRRLLDQIVDDALGPEPPPF